MLQPSRSLVIASLAIVFCSQSAATEAGPERQPKSLPVRKAIERYRSAFSRAEGAFRKSITAARKRLFEDLEPAERAATKKGDLDEANAIRDLRNTFEQQASALPGDGTGTLVAKVNKSTWDMGGGEVWWFEENGKAVARPPGTERRITGRWFPVGPSTIAIEFRNFYVVSFEADFKKGTWFGHSFKKPIARSK